MAHRWEMDLDGRYNYYRECYNTFRRDADGYRGLTTDMHQHFRRVQHEFVRNQLNLTERTFVEYYEYFDEMDLLLGQIDMRIRSENRGRRQENLLWADITTVFRMAIHGGGMVDMMLLTVQENHFRETGVRIRAPPQ